MERIVAIQKEDYRNLAAFLITFWKVDLIYWIDRFNFVWDKNPVFVEEPQRGFIVKKNGDILGFVGHFPTKFKMNTRNMLCSNGFSFLLDERLRGTGLAKQIAALYMETFKDNIHITTTPNKISSKILKSFRYQLLPRGLGDYNSYTIVSINKANTFKFFLHLLKHSKSVTALNTFHYNFSRYALHVTKKKLGKQLTENTPFKIIKIDKAGKNFDELWEFTKNQYQFTNIRNSDIINWYLCPTQYANREIYAIYKNNRLSGYTITRLTRFKNTRILLCIDIWTKKEDRENLIRNLVIFSKKQAEKKNCDVLLLPYFSKDLSIIYNNLGYGYKAIGAKRNDFFLNPKNVECMMTDQNMFITYMNGDKFLSKNAI